ncbi:MAG: lysophospholipase [Actinomycetota bacterium]|nr:lysophospholipase [Actinomycetota bacterium]
MSEVGRSMEPTVAFGTTADGLTQLRRRWATPGARAAVLLVHGIGEHSGRYLHVGRAFADSGFDVLAADGRGFGQSGGRRAYVNDFSEFLDDVEALLAERRTLGLPVVLVGHSLGGLISAAYLTSRRPGPDLAVLSAPALQAEIPNWQRLVAPVIGRVLPKVFVPSPIAGSLLSRDPAVAEAYVNDPLVVAGSTAGLGKAILEAMRSTTTSLDRITVPVYVLHGSADELVPPQASEPLAHLPGAMRRVWPGLRHECFNEPEQDDVLAEVVAWLDARLVDQLGGMPSSESPST